MNVLASIGTNPDAAAWNSATHSINAWRGELIQSFAHTEAAVSETLLALASIEALGAKIRLRHLIGQRLQDLHDALSIEGPFGAERVAVQPALDAFRMHEELRATLCHGVAKIAIDRKGQWVVLLRLVAFKAGAAHPQTMAFEQCGAEALLGDVKGNAQKLTSALGNLRAAMRR